MRGALPRLAFAIRRQAGVVDLGVARLQEPERCHGDVGSADHDRGQHRLTDIGIIPRCDQMMRHMAVEFPESEVAGPLACSPTQPLPQGLGLSRREPKTQLAAPPKDVFG